MARQILSPIDIRTAEQRRGLSSSQRNIQAITSILQTIGAAEQKRRERETLDRIVRAIGQGKTDAEAIAAVAGQQPQFGGGVQGILQRIGGAFQPPGGGGIRQSIQQTIIGQRLQQALRPPRAQIPPGLEPTGATVGPTGAVTRRFGLPKAAKPVKRKGFSFTEQRALGKAIPAALDAIAKQVERTAIKGRNKWAQADLIEPYKRVALEAGYETWSEDQRKQFDRKWDRLARAKFKPRKTISKETGKEINIGWNPNSPEVKQARRELRAGTTKTVVTKEITETDVRLQSAPDVRLDSIWGRLSNEQKKQILTQIDENPENLDTIITNILTRIQGAGS